MDVTEKDILDWQMRNIHSGLIILRQCFHQSIYANIMWLAENLSDRKKKSWVIGELHRILYGARNED